MRAAPRAVSFDVSAVVGEPAGLAATFYPAAGRPGGRVLVCLPGGTYNRSYWHFEVPGHAGYNFAEYAAERGFAVVAIDPLGTGDSSKPARDVDLADIAAALAGAMPVLGELTGAVGQPIVVAHSLGGYLAILQQSAFGSYSAMVLLGCTNQHVAPLNLDAAFIAKAATRQGRRELVAQITAAIPDPYVVTPRGGLQSWFHLPDVPADVVAADHAGTLSVVPRSFGAGAVPGITADEAGQIEVPLLLGYGEVDVSPDPDAEAGFYPRSTDVTTAVLPASGHCHNMAGTRHQLWDRLLSWAARTA